jgi:hypothetical protein
MKNEKNKNIVSGSINAGGPVITGDGNTIYHIQAEVQVEQLISDAKNSLKCKQYKHAQETFNKVLQRAPDNADIYFYLALSFIGGRRPKTLGPADAQKINSFIDMAIEKDRSKSHYFYLKAIIQYDFYVLNGFSDDIEKINGLLQAASNAVPHDKLIIEDMLKHTPGIDSEIAECIPTSE